MIRMGGTLLLIVFVALAVAGDARAQFIDLRIEPADHLVRGVKENDRAGAGVLFADVNGDGLDDIIVGATGWDFGNRSDCGAIHILMSSDTLASSDIDLGTPRNDLHRIYGPEDNAQLGGILAAGDINNDNRDDLVLGYPASSAAAVQAGEVWVIYGADPFPDTIDLETATSGIVRIQGVQFFDKAGTSVSVGNIDGDAFADIVVGAPFASGSGGSFSGKAYIVYGGSSLPAVISLAGQGTDITEVDGENANDTFGQSCYAADVTGDTVAELIVGAPQATALGRGAAGIAYVLTVSNRPTLITTNGNNSLTRIYGPSADAIAGTMFTAGDVNDDNIPDLVVGAPEYSPGGRNRAGASFVLAGTDQWPATIDLAETSNVLFRIDGNAPNVKSGNLASADLNMDGIDDIVVGIPKATPVVNRSEAGEAYLVFGRTVFPEVVDLSLQQAGVTRIVGAVLDDNLGGSVAAGKSRSTGFADVLLGAPLSIDIGVPGVPGDEVAGAGKAYVLLGNQAITPALLVSASAEPHGRSVLVQWILSEGVSTDDFSIERINGNERVRLAAPIDRLSHTSYRITDDDVAAGESYRYELSMRDELLFAIDVTVPRADAARLLAARPSPFSAFTRVPFSAPAGVDVTVRVFDVAGRLVAELHRGPVAGAAEVIWNGRNDRGRQIASGVYFIRLETAASFLQRKVHVIR